MQQPDPCPGWPHMLQVDCLAKRLWSLLLQPDSRESLLRLPYALLQQLLSSEAMEVDQVSAGGVWGWRWFLGCEFADALTLCIKWQGTLFFLKQRLSSHLVRPALPRFSLKFTLL